MSVDGEAAKLALNRVLGNQQEEMLNGIQPNTLTPQPRQLPFARTPPRDNPPTGTLPMSRLPLNAARLPDQQVPEWEKPDGDTTITPGGQKLIQGAGRTLGIAAYPSQATGMGIQGGLEALKNKPSIGKTGREPQPDAAANADPFQYMPGGAKYEEYQKLPIWQKFLYELPAIVAEGVAFSTTGGATELSQTLNEAATGEGNKAILAQMGQSALAPAVAVEQASAKILNALFGKSVKWLKNAIAADPDKWTEVDYQSYLMEKAFAESPMYNELVKSGIKSPALESQLREAFYKMGTMDAQDLTDASRMLAQIYNAYPQLRPEPSGTRALTLYGGIKFTPEEEAAMNELLRQQAAKITARNMAGNMAAGRPAASAYQPAAVANLESGQPPALPPIEPPKDFYKEAVVNLNTVAKDARKLRSMQSSERSAERAKRAGIVAGELQAGKGEQAFKSAESAITGRLAGEQFSPLREALSQEHLDALADKIRTSNLLSYTKLSTKDALDKLLYSGEVPTEREYGLLQAAFGTDLDVLIESKRSMGNKLWRNFVDLINLPRSFATSFDNSMPLRQLAMPVLGDAEKYGWPAVKDSFGGMFSGKYATELYQNITQDPAYPYAIEGDLPLFNPDSNMKLAGQEDIFISKYAKKIPIIGQGMKMSERGATSVLNSVRFKMFKDWMTIEKDNGTLTAEKMKQIASAVSIATGRGNIKGLNRVAPVLNSILYSTKYQASLLQTIPAMFDPKLPNSVRFRYGKQLGQYLALAAGVAGALKLAFGDNADIELDPRSTDFGKARIGNTRFDLGKGFLTYIRFAAQFATESRKLETGDVQKANREDLLTGFIRGKLSPSAGIFWDLVSGKMYGGEDITVSKELYNRMVPMVYQDMYEAFKEDGLIGLALAAPGFMGANVNTYASQEVEEWRSAVEQTMGKDYLASNMQQFTVDYQEQLPAWGEYFKLTSQREKEMYLTQHPEVEASMYFWGHKTNISSPQAWQQVQQMLQKYNLPETILPIRKSAETIDITKKSDAEVTGLVLDAAPKYLADYIVKNPVGDTRTFYTNLTQRKASDQDLLDQYARDTMGMTTSQREQYRYKNPEIDIALNLWGQVGTVKSPAARNGLIGVADEWGISSQAFPALTSKSSGKSGFTLPK